VVAEVAVVALVVVDGAGVLGPEFGFVKTEIPRPQEPLREVKEVAMKGQTVQIPGSPRSPDDAGKLT
jgi:hypothetical protein